MICKECETEIHPPKKLFCSRKCSGNYRRKHVYGDKYTNKYRALNPRNFMMCLLSKNKKREKISIDFLEELYNNQDGYCALTGIPMTFITGQGRVSTNISIDRIVVGGDYVASNIRLVCRQANIMRGELSDDELKGWCKLILK